MDNLLDDEDLTTIGGRLRYARRRAKLMTQLELAQHAGCPQSSVASLENRGKHSQYVPTFAQILGVNAVWLSQGSGPMRPASGVTEQYNLCSIPTQKLIDALLALDLELDTPRPELPPATWTILKAARELAATTQTETKKS